MNRKNIVIEMGSGTICNNDEKIIERMIDSIKAIDTGKHNIHIKWQLFENIKGLISLKREMFETAYCYANWKGYKTSASVFSKDDLYYLQDNFEVPFIKIANRPELYGLIKYIKKEIPIIISIDAYNRIDYLQSKYKKNKLIYLMCVSKYPQNITEKYLLKNEYESIFGQALSVGLSDHTGLIDLFHEYQPDWYESHYVLNHGENYDPFGDLFCLTSDDLRGIL